MTLQLRTLRGRDGHKGMRHSRTARSVHNGKHLATTDHFSADSLEERRTEFFKRAFRLQIRAELIKSLHVTSWKAHGEDLMWGATRANLKGWDPARDARRLQDCQKQWRGFKAKCCDSPAVAVPIGCNHRLCPLCNAQRLERHREPVRRMVAAMENPTFLTITVPNAGRLTRATFAEIRTAWKRFQKENSAVVRGGIYAIETTYNRLTRTWHPHIHVVYDSPYKMAGFDHASFVTLKMGLEFSWLRATSKMARRQFKSTGRGEQKVSAFQVWRNESTQQRKGCEWNKLFRRTVDVRRVQPGPGVAFEVIKYITKSTRFVDIPDAVAEFLIAVRGVRTTQSFGSFYNWKVEDEPEAIPVAGELGEVVFETRTFLKCECGKNDFHCVGTFTLSQVSLQSSGRWIINPHALNRRCRIPSEPPGEAEISWQ